MSAQCAPDVKTNPKEKVLKLSPRNFHQSHTFQNKFKLFNGKMKPLMSWRQGTPFLQNSSMTNYHLCVSFEHLPLLDLQRKQSPCSSQFAKTRPSHSQLKHCLLLRYVDRWSFRWGTIKLLRKHFLVFLSDCDCNGLCNSWILNLQKKTSSSIS